MVIPQCFDCRHLYPGERGKPMRCKAFPERIPSQIGLNEHDHHKPYPGDNGIRFEPIESEKNSDPV
jgi:hypothetical protein